MLQTNFHISTYSQMMKKIKKENYGERQTHSVDNNTTQTKNNVMAKQVLINNCIWKIIIIENRHKSSLK